MKAKVIKQKFLDFFAQRGHRVLASAPLVPENDPTALFNVAGMQPLVPYLLGESHPEGKRLASAQKCLRTVELDEENSIGDKSHHSFFEMLGNWSLGDYFKEESMAFSWEFLTDKEVGLRIDPKKIYVTIFEGDETAPYDAEAGEIWKKVYAQAGIEAKIWGKDEQSDEGEWRIFPLGKKDNWWSLNAENGPCGPDTEIFYYLGEGEPELEKERPGFNDDNFLEIWNNVFMEWEAKTTEGKTELRPLVQKNIDTGMGLERIAALMQGVTDNYASDLFAPMIKKIEEWAGVEYGREEVTDRIMRIIADHVRAATFLAGDGVMASNTDRGYVARRLIRRAIRQLRALFKLTGKEFDHQEKYLSKLAEVVIENYSEDQPILEARREEILTELEKEEGRFLANLERGLKRFKEVVETKRAAGEVEIDGVLAFDFYQTYGFPWEILKEMADEEGFSTDEAGFKAEAEKHKELSRTASKQMFKGGLADDKENTVKMHTATHLMLSGLKKALGENVNQKGANITAERIRFDFSWDKKVEPEQLVAVEEFVNQAIKDDVSVEKEEMSLDEARKAEACGVFDDRYNQEKVKVYTIPGFSKEICGGPHVEKTGILGRFKIIKEEACGAGVRRIKAILEDK